MTPVMNITCIGAYLDLFTRYFKMANQRNSFVDETLSMPELQHANCGTQEEEAIVNK